MKKKKSNAEKMNVTKNVIHQRNIEKFSCLGLRGKNDLIFRPYEKKHLNHLQIMKAIARLQQSHGFDKKLHKLCTKNMNNQFRNLACETDDEKVKSRFSILLTSDGPLAIVAYNMKYHLSCLVKNNRNAEKIQDDCINGTDDK